MARAVARPAPTPARQPRPAARPAQLVLRATDFGFFVFFSRVFFRPTDFSFSFFSRVFLPGGFFVFFFYSVFSPDDLGFFLLSGDYNVIFIAIIT